MSASRIDDALPQTCAVTVPSPNSNIHDIIPRWSDAGLALPYAAATPSNDNDIIETIKFATTHNLNIVPAAGGHGSFVPIDSRTIYMDLKKFNSIDLDEERGEVTVGGGCITGPLIKALAAKGWYTCTPNSNAVGVVGSLLGGLNHSVNGLHGIGVDFVRSFALIPFSSPGGGIPSQALVLSMESSGEEKKLFNVIRGAGHGLGIITSLTLKAYRISSLSLTEGKIWTRRLIFPPPALPTAISTYLSIIPLPELTAVLGFLRAPPTAPVPVAPMIMLALSYFGPKEDAERICAASFDEAVAGKAVSATTAMIEWGTMNDGFEPLNRHGGFKEYHSAFVQSMKEDSIQRAFAAWVDFTSKDIKSRDGSYIVIGASNNNASLANAGNESYFSARDRGIFVQVSPWYAEGKEKAEADAFGRSVVDALREKDKDGGRRSFGFANNWSSGQDVKEVFTEEQIEEIKRVKGLWDKANVGWSPVVDGWQD